MLDFVSCSCQLLLEAFVYQVVKGWELEESEAQSTHRRREHKEKNALEFR